MFKKHYWLGLAITYTVFILVISLVKINSKIDVKVPQVDKLVHFGIYFVFTILWFACFYSYRKTSISKNILKAAVLALFFGVLVEMLQHLNPIARSGDIKDVLANSLGVMAAVLVLKKTKFIQALKTIF